MLDKRLVNGSLIEGADRRLPPQGPAGAVVDAVARRRGPGIGHHDARPGLWISGEEDRMADIGVPGAGKGVMTGREGPCRPLAVDPRRLVGDDLAAGDVVAQKIHKLPLDTGKHLAEGLENEGVDEEVVERGEVGAEGHVVEIGVGLGRSQRRVDEFLVAPGKRDVPAREALLEIAKLTGGKRMPQPTRSAVGQERHLTVSEPEDVGRAPGAGVIGHVDHLTLAEVIAAAVGAELGDLRREVVDAAPIEMTLEAGPKGAARAIVAVVVGILAARCPFRRDAEVGADFLRGPFDEEPPPAVGRHHTPLLHMPLPAAGAGGDPVTDGRDQRPADGLVGDRLLRKIELEQAHRALDVDPDGPGIDVRRRDEDTADRGPIAAVAVGIEDEVSDSRGKTGIDRLLEANGVERRADRRRADHGDRLRRGSSGEDSGRNAGGNDLVHGTGFQKEGTDRGILRHQRLNRLPNGQAEPQPRRPAPEISGPLQPHLARRRQPLTGRLHGRWDAAGRSATGGRHGRDRSTAHRRRLPSSAQHCAAAPHAHASGLGEERRLA